MESRFVCSACLKSFGNNKKAYKDHNSGRCQAKLDQRNSKLIAHQEAIAPTFPSQLYTSRQSECLTQNQGRFNFITPADILYVQKNMCPVTTKKSTTFNLIPDIVRQNECSSTDSLAIRNYVYGDCLAEDPEPIMSKVRNQLTVMHQPETYKTNTNTNTITPKANKPIKKARKSKPLIVEESEESSSEEFEVPESSEIVQEIGGELYQDVQEDVTFSELRQTAICYNHAIKANNHLFTFSRLQSATVAEILPKDLLNCLIWYNEDFSKLPIEVRRHPNDGNLFNFLRTANKHLTMKTSLKQSLVETFSIAQKTGQDYYYIEICNKIKRSLIDAEPIDLETVYCYCGSCSTNHKKMNELFHQTPLRLLDARNVVLSEHMTGLAFQRFASWKLDTYQGMYPYHRLEDIIGKIKTEWQRMSSLSKREFIHGFLKPRQFAETLDIDRYREHVNRSYLEWKQRCSALLTPCDACQWSSNSGKALQYYESILPQLEELYNSRRPLTSSATHNEMGYLCTIYRLDSLMTGLSRPPNPDDVSEWLEYIKNNWTLLADSQTD